MEDPPPSRYPMMRSPRGGQHPANSNAHMHFPGRQFGAGNRSIGSRPSGTGHFPSIGGQKRDSSGFAVTGSPARHGGPGQGGSSQDSPEGGNFVKLFVGSVPRTVTEDDIRPLFAEHGNVLEVALIKEKRTGQQQGCCFIKYATIEEADRAIRALHNQRTLPGGIGPIQVRYADGERERLGAVEYKLFVGSLNRLATEKEIEEIFAPYGRVDDVYIMRDEQKQSRGCAFVKYPSREMASSAINALSGTYVMKGCDQPLTVRFADPKRPKTGEMRGAPAFGGPGFGPRPQGPLGARPPPGSGWHTGRGPPTNWRTLGTPNTVPPPHVGTRPYGSPSTQRGGPVGASAIGGPMGTAGASANGSLQGPVVATAPSQQQGFSPPSAYQQLQGYAQQSSSSQKPSQVQQQLPPAMQQEKTQTSHSQVQTPQLAVHQFGQQVQTSQLGVQQLQSSQPLAQQQASFGQIPSSQQSLPVYSQLSISQSQLQQHVALGLQQVSSSLQQHQSSISAVQPSSQQSQLQPQLQLQTQSQVPTQMQLQQQTQSQQQQTVPLQSQSQIQSAFQSQQHLFLQQQHQLHLMQPATQSQQQPQTTQTQKQQTYYQVAAVQSVNQQPSWVLATQPQSVVSTPTIVPVTMSPSAGTAASVVSLASASTLAPMPCSWTEHTSPEGYKYYYNSVTKESRWEKPEELTAFEEQQQQQKQQQQLSQSQPQLVTQQQQLQPQNQLRQQQSQILQHQSQMLQPALAMPYTGPGMVAHQPIQNLGYGQLQGASAATVEQSHQVQQHQGLLTMQDWAWKAKPAGT